MLQPVRAPTTIVIAGLLGAIACSGGMSGEVDGGSGGDDAQSFAEVVYVDGIGGADVNVGSMEEPLATISAGIAIADRSTPPATVLVSNGTYEEAVVLRSGVSVYGGYAASQGWERDIDLYVTELSGPLIAVTADTIIAPTVVDGLTIVSASATGIGTSSIAMLVTDSTGLELNQVVVVAGNGGPGADGAGGATGGVGTTGGSGTPGCENSGVGCEDCDAPAVGDPGGSACGRLGGAGGTAGLGGGSGGAGETGAGGTPGGGGGGGGGDGTVGESGAAGQAGTDGDGGAALGVLTDSGYATSDGGDGTAGSHGNGGGGGGGGGGGDDYCDSYGSSGGGGGGGGCGGVGGGGGIGGGGSFGIIMIDSAVTLTACDISAGRGGVGGAGAGGGIGGDGGGPGSGGAYGGSGEQDDGGMGADGGSGGRGGDAGDGGGGGGGPSAALACVGETSVLIPTTQLYAEGGGDGGHAPVNPGANGLTTLGYNCALF